MFAPATSTQCTCPAPSPTNATSAPGATHSEYAKSPSACDEREATVVTVSETLETLTVSARSARRSSTVAYPSAPAVTTRRLPAHCAISLTAPAPRARACACACAAGRPPWRSSQKRAAPSWPPDASSGVAFGSAPSTQRRAVQWPSCASRDDTNEPDAASQRSTAPPRSPLASDAKSNPNACAPNASSRTSATSAFAPLSRRAARRSAGARCPRSVATAVAVDPTLLTTLFFWVFCRRQRRTVLSYDALATRPSSASTSDTDPPCPSNFVGTVS